MTNEEAIKIIDNAMTTYGEDAIDYDKVFEAKDIAIRSLEALEQKKKIIHCKDCKYRDYWGDCTKWSKELDAHKSYILDENMFCGFAERKYLKEVENDT